MMNSSWLICPVCGGKTRDQIRKDTVLINYPLYCPKCKQTTLINVNEWNAFVVCTHIDKSHIHKAGRSGKALSPRFYMLCSFRYLPGASAL